MWFSNIFESNDPILNKNIPYISTSDIEFIIQDQDFNINQYKNSVKLQAEWKKAMPLINVSFHYHLLRDENIPTLDEFIQDYERDNHFFIKLISDELYTGIKYRLVRAYPSLVRDVHFVSTVRELGYEAIHTLQLDLNGIDAVVYVDTHNLLFRLFFDSKKSRKYCKNKKKMHDLDNCVDMPLNARNARTVGGIYLYKPEDILLKIIEVSEGLSQLQNEIENKKEITDE